MTNTSTTPAPAAGALEESTASERACPVRGPEGDAMPCQWPIPAGLAGHAGGHLWMDEANAGLFELYRREALARGRQD